MLYLDNTCESDIKFSQPYHTVLSVKDFGIKTVKRGFQRRPELIRQRVPEVSCSTGSRLVNNLSYGLYDKCERIQRELTHTTLELMGISSLVLEDTDTVHNVQHTVTIPAPCVNPLVRAATGIGGCMRKRVNAMYGQCVLDIGCGYGFSLQALCGTGVCATGVDMDLQALSVLQHKTCCQYLPPHRVHMVRSDITYGFCFRESVFDWAISISFLQWLCAGKNPLTVLSTFFQSLSSVLKPAACSGIQFYPRHACDVQRVISEAQKHFKGALVSDHPHIDRGRKLFLVLINNK